MNSFFTLADACDAGVAALGPSELVEKRKSDDLRVDIEVVWNVSDLCRSSERYSKALENVKALCQSLALPVPTTIVEAQRGIEDTIRTFADYPLLDASVKTKDGDFAAAQEGWKQGTAAYEKEWAEVKQEVNDKSADLPNAVKPTSIVVASQPRLTSSQSRTQLLKEKLRVSLMKIWKGASAEAHAEQAISKFRNTFQAP